MSILNKGLIDNKDGTHTPVELYADMVSGKGFIVRIYEAYVPGSGYYPQPVYHESARGSSKRAVKARVEKFLGHKVQIDWMYDWMYHARC